MAFTHKKRAYYAECVQWRDTPETTEAVRAMFPSAEVHEYDGPRGRYIFLRFAPGEISTLRFGDWAVKGENGVVKVYSDDVFHVKYEEK